MKQFQSILEVQPIECPPIYLRGNDVTEEEKMFFLQGFNAGYLDGLEQSTDFQQMPRQGAHYAFIDGYRNGYEKGFNKASSS